jgi:hypothetical protein
VKFERGQRSRGLPTVARVTRAKIGGEAGIRTLGTTLRSYNGLANRRLRPLGHLTARLQVYVTKTLTWNPIEREAVKATAAYTVAFDAKCNHKQRLYRCLLFALGTRVWAHSWAHSAGFSRGLFRKRKEDATRRRFF